MSASRQKARGMVIFVDGRSRLLFSRNSYSEAENLFRALGAKYLSYAAPVKIRDPFFMGHFHLILRTASLQVTELVNFKRVFCRPRKSHRRP